MTDRRVAADNVPDLLNLLDRYVTPKAKPLLLLPGALKHAVCR